MAARGSCAILPIHIDQVLRLISVALDQCRSYLRVVDEAAPKSDPSSLQLGGADFVTCRKR